MKTFFKALAGLVSLVLLAGCIALAAVATRPRLMSYAVRQVLKRTAPQVQTFRIETLYYSFPSSWVLGRVNATVLVTDKPIRISLDQVEIQDALHLLSDGKITRVDVRGASVADESFKACGGSCTADLIRSTHGVAYVGLGALAEIAQESLRMTEIRTDFTGDAQSVVLSNLTAEVYSGLLSGRAESVFGPPAGYDITLAVDAVDCGELETALGGVFRELGGTLSGQVQIAGTGNQVDRFDTSWNMPAGGAVSAELLSAITRYIPDSTQKKRLDFLIRSGGKLPVESFVLTLKNDAPDRLSGIIGVKSLEANLELNVTHEIQVDTRIDSLIQVWKAMSK